MRRIERALSPHNIGWWLPASLGAIFAATSIIAYAGLPEIRVLAYVALIFSLPFGIRALIRQMQKASYSRGEWPSFFQVVLFWQKVALLVLATGVFISFLDRFFPPTPNIPTPIYAGMIMTGALAITITDLSLYFGGRAHVLSVRSRPGPIRLFVKDPDD